MQSNKFLRWVIVMSGCAPILLSTGIRAKEKVPCLIFTGNSESEFCADLSVHNRIYFKENSILLTSSNEDEDNGLALPYYKFNHFNIAETIPSLTVGTEDIDVATGDLLRYDNRIKSLLLFSSNESSYDIGIYNTKGTLIAVSSLAGGQSLSLEAVSPGVYIAVAINNESKLTLKFIIK